MKPTIGRIVHYVDDEGRHCAAVITRVWTDTCVNLVVFELYDGCPSVVHTSVVSDEEPGLKISFTWHWPERE